MFISISKLVVYDMIHKHNRFFCLLIIILNLKSFHNDTVDFSFFFLSNIDKVIP